MVKKVLETTGKPMTSKEIWDKAAEMIITKDFASTKTVDNIAQMIAHRIKRKGINSTFIRTSTHPTKFFLDNAVPLIDEEHSKVKQELQPDEPRIKESVLEWNDSSQNIMKSKDGILITESDCCYGNIPGEIHVQGVIKFNLDMKITLANLQNDMLVKINYGEEDRPDGLREMEVPIREKILSMIVKELTIKGKVHGTESTLVHFPARFYIQK